LALAVAMLVAPAIFHYTAQSLHDVKIVEHEHRISMASSIVLLVVYGLGLLFTLRTHAHIYSPAPARSDEDKPGLSGIHGGWSVKFSVIMLLVASAGIAIVAELLVKSAAQLALTLGWNEIFIGVILLAIIGNAAEHSTAMVLAWRDDMDTAMTIVYQSSLQIALFVTPFLVLVSAVFVATGISPPTHLNLVFSPMEVVSVMVTVLVTVVIGINGESNWFEGVLLLALYLILAICFFYIPGGAATGAVGH
jgi:Ca2+:H+ antiporter